MRRCFVRSLLDVPKYAGPPQENLMVRDDYWDDDWDDEEVFEDDDIDEF